MDTRISEDQSDMAEAGSTLAERTYIQLRNDIITARLLPGSVLREGDLMARLNVGRTPVREALLLLQRDGFVEVNGRRGTFVSVIEISDLTAVYEARARTESWVARLAAERLNDAEREQALSLIAELKALEHPTQADVLLALDRRIHRFIYRTAKNQYLYDSLDHYHNLSLRILYVAMRRFPSLVPGLDRVVQEQVAMLEAVCRGDGEAAERIALHHVQSFEQDVRKFI
jgi:DNA-binding GntR family transcriptional regulator